MTTIRTTCPPCGDVILQPSEVSLLTNAMREDGAYRFVCPFCTRSYEVDADPRVVDLLVAAGCVEHAKQRHPSSQITEEEIREFMAEFEPKYIVNWDRVAAYGFILAVTSFIVRVVTW